MYIRSKTSSLLLAASLMAMMIGPITVTPHEACSNAMRHGCATIDALASCCCGDSSNTDPSRVPSERANITSVPDAVIPAIVLALPQAVPTVLRKLPEPMARPPDLSILFSDLRI
jgi:hypothetical protein